MDWCHWYLPQNTEIPNVPVNREFNGSGISSRRSRDPKRRNKRIFQVSRIVRRFSRVYTIVLTPLILMIPKWLSRSTYHGTNVFNTTCRALTLDVLSGHTCRDYDCVLKRGDVIATCETLSYLFGYFHTMSTWYTTLRYFDWDGQVHLTKVKKGGHQGDPLEILIFNLTIHHLWTCSRKIPGDPGDCVWRWWLHQGQVECGASGLAWIKACPWGRCWSGS